MVIDKVAWVLLEDGRLLGARSHGMDAFYLPGGKREPGETDVDALLREIAEELTVSLVPETFHHVGTYEAPAHGKTDVTVRMTCYTADYSGTLTPQAEIAEIAWLTHADRDRVSAANRLVLDTLHTQGLLIP
ncbi:NUDIX domain-containing protein [Nonomuraea sp. NPDC003804]|uniref:NUDIX hydrolase n=1 Tax=Nonomuraea sp. NPDC003804 TaxID=3154547 RepID=UPI0033B52B57